MSRIPYILENHCSRVTHGEDKRLTAVRWPWHAVELPCVPSGFSEELWQPDGVRGGACTTITEESLFSRITSCEGDVTL